jgi:hypothetical protein
MLVPETVDGFGVTISAPQFRGESEGVCFHTFSLPEDRRVCLLLKNLGKRMPEAEIPEELEGLHIHVQTVMQLQLSRRWDHNAEKESHQKPHFITSLERGSDVPYSPKRRPRGNPWHT